MTLYKVEQIQYHEIDKDLYYDVLIVASGYETRARFLSENIRINASKKYAISFNTHEDKYSKQDNDSYFKNSGFELVIGDSDNAKCIHGLFETIFVELGQKKVVNLIVDYSSMSRVWYATLLDRIRNSSQFAELNIFFCYTKGKFTEPPKEDKFNLLVEPIIGYSSLSIPNKPTALVIGLGYERNRAFGLKEYFDAETFLFYTDSVKENSYSKDVEKKNEDLINKTKKENIFKFPIDDLNYTFSILMSLSQDLNDDYRVILAPCGPKIFTLLCLLVSLKNSEIDVWRISPGKSATPIDYEPEGDPLVLKVSFVQEEIV